MRERDREEVEMEREEVRPTDRLTSVWMLFYNNPRYQADTLFLLSACCWETMSSYYKFMTKPSDFF